MTIEIEDKSIEQILQAIVKKEVDFLAKELIARREVRFSLWCWLLSNFYERGIKVAGIEDEVLEARLTAYFEKSGEPMPTGSGPGGGGDSGDRDGEGPSGGGGTEPPILAGSCAEGAAPLLVFKAKAK